MPRRKLLTVTSLIAWSSMRTCPDVTSKNRGKRLIMVLLPAPLGPTSATVCPGFAVKCTSCSAASMSLPYENPTLSKVILPAVICNGLAPLRSVICRGVSSRVRMRSAAANPSLVTAFKVPMARTGCTSRIRVVIKAITSPTCISPRATRQLASATTPPTATPPTTSRMGSIFARPVSNLTSR